MDLEKRKLFSENVITMRTVNLTIFAQNRVISGWPAFDIFEKARFPSHPLVPHFFIAKTNKHEQESHLQLQSFRKLIL